MVSYPWRLAGTGMSFCSQFSEKTMQDLRIFSHLLAAAIFLLPFSSSQLSPLETRILFQVQKLLEYPPSLQAWNNWTNFCYLPASPSLAIACSNNRLTELTIVGNRSSPSRILNFSPSSSAHALSENFSIDTFFTVLTKLSSLRRLSLVSLGLWGPLPPKINRFRSLEVLNVSANFLLGGIPQSVATYRSLKTLSLADNMLNGSVPDLGGMVSLEELDLRRNYFGPKFPSLGTDLVRLSLANNSFRSEIPQDWKILNRLRELDVSSNNLLGPIPPFLFSLSALERLNLARNQLSGAFGQGLTCGRNLTFVDVSTNLLIGKLPPCLDSNKAVHTVITWNCFSNTSFKYQRPYSFCQKEALAVNPPERRAAGKEPTLKLGIVIGIMVAVVAALGAAVLLAVVVFRRKRGSQYNSESFVIDRNPHIRGSPLTRHVPVPMRMMSIGLPPYTLYTLEEMEDATNKFDPSNLVGEGSQGQVYKGWLRDGSAVLVKCLKVKQKHSSQALQQHMDVISRLRHRHLASVLGHCIVTHHHDHPNTAATVFVVLENISTGSLSDHLTNRRRRDVLKWPQRMGITMGIARGIQHLHNGGILGNDLKIDNILLDESLTAKVSSYNISLPAKVVAESPLNGPGTQNHPRSENPEKEDIYMLGVILTEVLIGKPITSPTELDDIKFQLERSLAESSSRIRELIDPVMRGSFAYESLKTVVQITVNCLCKDPIGRPNIEDVLWHMQYSVQVQEGWTSSGNLSGNLSNKF